MQGVLFRLLERCVKLADSLDGGSVTALPLVETQEGDVSADIPPSVSVTNDGQLLFWSNLFNEGIRPAINVGIILVEQSCWHGLAE